MPSERGQLARHVDDASCRRRAEQGQERLRDFDHGEHVGLEGGFVTAIAGAAAITINGPSHDSGPIAAAHASEAKQAPAVQVDVATVIAKPIAEWQTYSGRMEAVEKVDNLGYTQVVAPVSGRISRAELTLGVADLG